MATAAQLAVVALWVEQFAQASEDLKASTAAAAAAAWLAFAEDGNWYDSEAVAAVAAQMAQLSQSRQQTVAGTATAYVAQVVAALSGGKVQPGPRQAWAPVRNGVDLRLVHMRPANRYKNAIANGYTHQQALNLAFRRAADTLTSDITLAERDASQRMLDQLGIVTFRRILRPELSRTGSCGLCIAAADRVYSTGDLMPLHPPTCKCIVMPVIGENDPGRDMNDADLEALYAEAGGKSRDKLARVRYQVNEHGELGPVLTKEGDAFRGPSKVALEDDPERAARMLAGAVSLEDMANRVDAGLVKPGALDYQRDYLARLEAIVGTAA